MCALFNARLNITDGHVKFTLSELLTWSHTYSSYMVLVNIFLNSSA